MITRPPGLALSFHRGLWHIVYYFDDKRRTKSTGTDDLELARPKRDEFFKGVAVKERKPHTKKSRYIYLRKPYLVKKDNIKIGEYDTYEEAERERDKYLNENF